MASIQNARVLFNSVPEGYLVPGETTVDDTTQSSTVEFVFEGGRKLCSLVLIFTQGQLGRNLLRPLSLQFLRIYELSSTFDMADLVTDQRHSLSRSTRHGQIDLTSTFRHINTELRSAPPPTPTMHFFAIPILIPLIALVSVTQAFVMIQTCNGANTGSPCVN
ncbi:hypothetical protein B0H17DRAFT_1134089 [Mycena rosella]|uniref:Uncharacterized protein n=1 Tax=Mycena rosella TaxID=1033263 RepID=A0AAD7GEJ8_MYCRO|nr:hypothetical protein B0H17DRAFT_1134089 [Mycena rosella]